jgi:hypothetical protein
MVVDSNYLQTDELRRYFAKSSNNFVVITEDLSREAYKGDTLTSIYKSMAILSRFPRQVIVLKQNWRIGQLKGRRAGFTKRMIDEKTTRFFPNYVKNLKAAQDGDLFAQAQILALGKEANRQASEGLVTVGELPESFAKLHKIFSKEELRFIRTQRRFTEEIFLKVAQGIHFFYTDMLTRHSPPDFRPKDDEISVTHIFRFSLCLFVMIVLWMTEGSPVQVKPEKTRNDLTDVGFATMALYFDGLLSNDKKLLRLYDTAKAILARFA